MIRKQQEKIKQAEKALAALSGLTTPHPLRASSARRRMLEHAARLRASTRPAPRRRFAILMRLGLAFSLTVFAVAALTGIAAAADRSVPGDPLYPLDLSMEQLALAVAPHPRDRVALLLSFATERLAEFEVVNSANGNGRADIALAAYDDLITRLTTVIDSADEGDQPALVEMSEEALSRQEQHLLDVRQDAPVQAQPGLDRAIDAAQHGQDKVHQHGKPEETPGPPGNKPENPGHPTHPVTPGE